MYEIYLAVNNRRIAGPIADIIRLDWSICLNAIGACKIELTRLDPNILNNTGLCIELWRNDVLIQVFYVTDYGQETKTSDRSTRKTTWLRGRDLNDILARRIVAAAAGSDGAEKTGAAADVMAEYVTEALLNGDERDISDEFNLSLNYLPGGGATIHYAASHGQLISVLTGCAAASEAAGVPMRFWLSPSMPTPTASGVLHIRYPMGQGRTSELPFSPESGTLYNPSWSYETGDNYAYVGGQGRGEDRLVVEVDLPRPLSVMMRREAWLENSQISNEDTLTDWGLAQLWKRAGRYRFSAELRDTERARFGVNWALGDLVRAEYEGRVWDGEITAVAGHLDENGESVVAKLNAERIEV